MTNFNLYSRSNLGRGEIVNKRNLFIVLVVLIFMSVSIFQLSRENNLLKSRQGEIIQTNILRVQVAVSCAQEDLGNENVNISNLYEYYWKFNEYSSMLELPKIGIVAYLMNMRNDFSELIKLRENNLSQQEIDVVEIRLKSQLSKLQRALSLIRKECKNDSIKYDMLNTNDNKTMKNVLDILTEEN